jgi:hypothetical protein
VIIRCRPGTELKYEVLEREEREAVERSNDWMLEDMRFDGEG